MYHAKIKETAVTILKKFIFKKINKTTKIGLYYKILAKNAVKKVLKLILINYFTEDIKNI
jgi:hypothetical protein